MQLFFLCLAPSAVNKLSAIALSHTSIIISWNISDSYRVTYIQITYNSTCSGYNNVTITDLSSSNKSHYTYNISQLYSGMIYTVSVRAGNPVGLSQTVVITEETLPTGKV